MKFLSAIIIALPFIGSAQASGPAPEKQYAILMIGGMLTATTCDAKVVPGGMVKFSDKIGVDGDKLYKAVMAAVNVLANQPYDRDDLIPETTQTVRAVAEEMMAGFEANKKKTCNDWSKMLKGYGVIE